MAEVDASQPSQDLTAAEPQTQEKDIDASIEADINMSGTSHPNAMNLDVSGDLDPTSAPELDRVAPAPDSQKKDASLREFLNKMDDYAPIVRY